MISTCHVVNNNNIYELDGSFPGVKTTSPKQVKLAPKSIEHVIHRVLSCITLKFTL